MKKLSTGDNSTLGNYRKLATGFFGENSNAVKFLDKKINKQGENEEVIKDERQTILLLAHLTNKLSNKSLNLTSLDNE